MKYHLISFALLLGLNLPAASAMQAEPQKVSLIQLIATPEKYQGKFVRVEGFLHKQFEDSAIYVTKNDADHLICMNALWVSYAEKVLKEADDPRQKGDNLKYFDGKFVLIEGYFNPNMHGHLGAFAGSIEKTSRVMELSRVFDRSKPVRKM